MGILLELPYLGASDLEACHPFTAWSFLLTLEELEMGRLSTEASWPAAASPSPAASASPFAKTATIKRVSMNIDQSNKDSNAIRACTLYLSLSILNSSTPSSALLAPLKLSSRGKVSRCGMDHALIECLLLIIEMIKVIYLEERLLLLHNLLYDSQILLLLLDIVLEGKHLENLIQEFLIFLHHPLGGLELSWLNLQLPHHRLKLLLQVLILGWQLGLQNLRSEVNSRPSISSPSL